MELIQRRQNEIFAKFNNPVSEQLLKQIKKAQIDPALRLGIRQENLSEKVWYSFFF